MNLGKAMLDALYPPRLVCPLCNRETQLGEDGLCADCRTGFLPYGKLDSPDGWLDGLTAGIVYNHAVKAAMHRFKYGRQCWLAAFFAQFMEIPGEWKVDCVTPVPLHWFRRWLRTFNQSQELAENMLKRYPGIPLCTHILKRIRYTRQQALLSAEERKKNVANAFLAKGDLAGKRILLIDDVTTTHGTLNACAETLKRAGAEKVYALTACITCWDGKNGERESGK